MASNPPYATRGQNKWERRKQEFLAGPWTTRGDYLKERRIGVNNQVYAITKDWDLEKQEILEQQTETVKVQIVEANQPIKIMALETKNRVMLTLYEYMKRPGKEKDIKWVMAAYHVSKVELGEPENITRNINEQELDLIPDELLEQLKNDALNETAGREPVRENSDQAEEA